MTEWNLPTLLKSLHDDIANGLGIARSSFGHPVDKGDVSEDVWLKLLQDYLPKRYQAEKAQVVDSNGAFSQQMDVVVFDRQYSPFIFHFRGKMVVPAESVYAVFESKQAINADQIKYAREKVESVRKLHRTTLPIPHAGGTFPAKPPIQIIGGILTLDSDWSPPLGDPLKKALAVTDKDDLLDCGCVAQRGHFYVERETGKYVFEQTDKAGTAFLFRLISMLQFSGTVPMIDIQAYAKWLDD